MADTNVPHWPRHVNTRGGTRLITHDSALREERMKLKHRHTPPAPERSFADEIQHMVE
jgi:hypothetical protein